jgi:hypothetical protein
MAQLMEGDVTHSAGTAAAPALNTAIAAGAIAPESGWYIVEADVAAMDTVAVGKGMVVEHRNAANSATTRQLGGCVAGESRSIRCERLYMLTGERVRVVSGSAAGAASSLYVARVSILRVA